MGSNNKLCTKTKSCYFYTFFVQQFTIVSNHINNSRNVRLLINNVKALKSIVIVNYNSNIDKQHSNSNISCV